MTVREHPCVPDGAVCAVPDGAVYSVPDRAVHGDHRADGLFGGAGRVPADLAEADRLIADLAALVDAGLVVVRGHVLGPARYEATSELGGAA